MYIKDNKVRADFGCFIARKSDPENYRPIFIMNEGETVEDFNEIKIGDAMKAKRAKMHDIHKNETPEEHEARMKAMRERRPIARKEGKVLTKEEFLKKIKEHKEKKVK